MSTLKGKLKIKEGECLSSLGRAKKASIKERDNKRQKSIQKKYIELQTLAFGINDKASNE